MPHPNVRAVVRHPGGGGWVSIDPAKNYDDDDPIVTEYAWAFDPQPASRREAVEVATAAPGQKRTRGKRQ